MAESSSEVAIKQRAYAELGSSGLRRWGGYVDEEFLPQLRGKKAVAVYREMSENDPIVGAMLFAIEKLLRTANWRVEPASQEWEDLVAANFVEECMDDMSHTWSDFIAEILSMLIYGWSWHEVVYKRRMGDVRNPMFRSKFNDGMIGWRKMPIRAQETLHEWVFDEDGGVKALTQLAPPDYKNVTIPIERSLLFRPSTHKNNPEGRSILRNAYRPWYFKKRIEEIEGIGIERDLAGLPVAKIPAEFTKPTASDDKKAVYEAYKKLVRQVRRDEQEGLVLPMEYDQNGKELYTFELLSTGGSRQIDVGSVVERYDNRIAMTVLADFILVGHEQTGSYALNVSKTGVFRTALNSFMDSITEVLNRYAIPRLFAVNQWEMSAYPEFVHSEVDPPDLSELGEFIAKITGAGMTMFPDPDLEGFIREAAKLPEKSPEVEMMQEQQRQEQQAMQMEMAAQAPEEPGPPPPPKEATKEQDDTAESGFVFGG